MNKSDRKRLAALPIAVLLGALLAIAGSEGGAVLGSAPIFMLAVATAFLIQWIVFIPSFLTQTEKYYDLTGTLTYSLITVLIVGVTPNLDARKLLLAALVLIWTMRLGVFLFQRIHSAGKDDRFDEIKPSFIRFLGVWTIQALWVTFTAASAWVAMTSTRTGTLDWFAFIGLLVWVIGFGIEVVADQQKARFNADARNKGKFISSGLWSKSRHPNYFGEILVWIGIAMISFPVLQGWQLIALISPIFVIILLTKVSGIPLLEKKSEAKWGGQHDYEAYKKATPVLIPTLSIFKRVSAKK